MSRLSLTARRAALKCSEEQGAALNLEASKQQQLGDITLSAKNSPGLAGAGKPQQSSPSKPAAAEPAVPSEPCFDAGAGAEEDDSDEPQWDLLGEEDGPSVLGGQGAGQLPAAAHDSGGEQDAAAAATTPHVATHAAAQQQHLRSALTTGATGRPSGGRTGTGRQTRPRRRACSIFTDADIEAAGYPQAAADITDLATDDADLVDVGWKVPAGTARASSAVEAAPGAAAPHAHLATEQANAQLHISSPQRQQQQQQGAPRMAANPFARPAGALKATRVMLAPAQAEARQDISSMVASFLDSTAPAGFDPADIAAAEEDNLDEEGEEERAAAEQQHGAAASPQPLAGHRDPWQQQQQQQRQEAERGQYDEDDGEVIDLGDVRSYQAFVSAAGGASGAVGGQQPQWGAGQPATWQGQWQQHGQQRQWQEQGQQQQQWAQQQQQPQRQQQASNLWHEQAPAGEHARQEQQQPRLSSGAADGGRSDPPWWQRFPDFVPVGALRSGGGGFRDPRDDAPVFISYRQQFTGARGGGATAEAAAKSRAQSRGAGRAAAPRADRAGGGAAQSKGHWEQEGGKNVYINARGKKLYGQRGYVEHLKESGGNIGGGDDGGSGQSGSGKRRRREGGPKQRSFKRKSRAKTGRRSKRA